MNNRAIYRYLLVITLFVAASLSCNFIMDPINKTIEIGQTAESVATDIEGLATSIDLEGIATDIDLGSVATEIGELATQVEEEGVLETMQAEMTAIPDLTGEKPEDIPVMEGEVTGLVGTAGFVTYFVKTPFQQVVDFYESQMPANGWVKVGVESEVGEEFARLVFEKDERKAIVNIAAIPFLDQVSVTIEIQG